MKTLRRISQILLLLFFFYLFLKASFPLSTKIPVDLFLRADPLLAISSIVSARVLINTFLLALILVIITLPLGRVFCGWACPLGTSLDIFSYILKNKMGKSFKKLLSLKYYILIFLLAGAIFSSQLIWFLDPIPLFTRSFTLSIFPVITGFFTLILNFMFQFIFLQDWLSKIQLFFSSTLLPTQVNFFRMSSLFLIIILTIFVLEFISRRFWCRNLCPLGALYAFLSKFQLLKRRVTEDCTECGICKDLCKMDAIEKDFKKTLNRECILCYDCVKDCPVSVTKINFKVRFKSQRFDLGRRKVLSSTALGLVSVGLLKSSFKDRNLKTGLIRPPGSRVENEFLDRCIRCHECIKVCSTSGNFLQPAFLEGGLEGFWTPVGCARTGYCEYNCIMCTQVCPTQAIHSLDLATKKKTVIGLAFIDRNKCIPWYKNVNCLVCEEHCPIPDKAIKLKEEEVVHYDGSLKKVKRPYVVEDLCIGCGICETKCPVEGRSAIYITPQGEQRYK
ncbi:MAG: 4Fe-4S binding protein [candidate division Zixibacteria bacterium]|nr:4Fe-4S binding protein [candidate division Zixibacteria bacterium]